MVKNPPANAGDIRDTGLIPVSPEVGKILWRRAWQLTPVFLPGESNGRGAWQATVYRVARELDTTEVTKHSYTGENSIVLFLKNVCSVYY